VSGKSGISWTEFTWNPITGCQKVSSGCRNCYAERESARLHKMGSPKYSKVFEPVVHHDLINQPIKWTKPRMIFVCSMSDLFQEAVPDEIIISIFETMNMATQHTFQVLTKRIKRAFILAENDEIKFTDNIWIGTSTEDSKSFTDRAPFLKMVKAKTRFLSMEPLIGGINPFIISAITNMIHWVIVGGESGPGHRPIEAEWVRAIRDQCVSSGIPFHFKQWGGVRPKSGGRLLDGVIWDQMPAHNEGTE
jgi:protein gp37